MEAKGNIESSGIDKKTIFYDIVCPCCKAELKNHEEAIKCQKCSKIYHWKNGFPELMAESSDCFDDVLDEQRDLLEENADRHAVVNYHIPLLKQLYTNTAENIRILSCGCGVGIDVDLFNEHGYDACGIDCGERVWIWNKRSSSGRLYIANAKALPFRDNEFDYVVSGCMLPHIGVVGDSATVKDDYNHQRCLAVREMVRVIKPGGYILVSNPNRLCPVDFWHRGQMKDSQSSLLRFHSMFERFLLSPGDLRRFFINECHCRSIKVMPIDGYWGFLQKSQHPRKKYFVPLIRTYFKILSLNIFAWLRSTPLNPWLIILAQK